MKKDEAVLHVEIPSSLRESLRLYCVKKNKTQKEVVIYALQTLIDSTRAEPIIDTIKRTEHGL